MGRQTRRNFTEVEGNRSAIFHHCFLEKNILNLSPQCVAICHVPGINIKINVKIFEKLKNLHMQKMNTISGVK